MTEIKVHVPDAFTGSDLTWQLDASARVRAADGHWTVEVHANGDLQRALAQIRAWVIRERVGTVTVEVDGRRYELGADA